MKYAINLSQDNRIVSATYEKYASPLSIIVDELPNGDIADYLFQNGKYVYSPLKPTEDNEDEPSSIEILNALLGVNA